MKFQMFGVSEGSIASGTTTAGTPRSTVALIAGVIALVGTCVETIV